MLGRAFFSEQLGKAIYDYTANEGLVIGLYGKWGTGKTSVINMALDEIRSLSIASENKPIVMKFSPWNYSDKDNLISLYFQCLKKQIESNEDEELKRKVGKALNDYAGAFDALSIVPVFGSGIAAVLKSVAQAQGTRLMEGANLEESRAKLENALMETRQRIIVVIDDIDRLTNSQIRDIFQLVKQVADFPNVVYLMAMDREVVARALESVHGCDGNEYLEKILQVTFEIPDLDKSKLRNIFLLKLELIVKEMMTEIQWDEKYWGEVFNNCVAPFIETLRDVNRVINTFQFKYRLLYQETAFEDMIAITTLEVLEPELYKWICSNKDCLCGGYVHSFERIGGKKIDYRERYTDVFKNLGIDYEKAVRCLATLFPVFAKDVSENTWGYQPYSNVRSHMRMAEDSRFELYFKLDFENVKVSRTTINACINDMDENAIKALVIDINEQGKTIYFLEEIRSLVDKIPYERIPVIFKAFLDGGSELKGENQKGIFVISAIDHVEYLAEDLLNKLESQNERFDLLKNTIECIDKNGLGTLGRIINGIELAYGRLAGDHEKKDKQVISIQQLEEIEQVYLDRLRTLAKSDDLIKIDGFGIVLYLWECFDKPEAKEYFDDILKNDILKLKFICSLAGRWNGTNGSGWTFYSKNYNEYVSDEEIYKLICSVDKRNLDDYFSNEEQIKLASFYLNYGKDEIEHANESSAQKQIKAWKNQI